MICASCGSSDATQASACPDCGGDPVLDERYVLLEVIGKGGAGVTYRARRLDNRAIVCVKELAYNRLADFDAQKMFEREASVLRQLDHRGIPAFIDHFTAGEGKALSLYLVQEFVEGGTLEHEMAGARYTERQVLAILDELAEILAYLEDLRPRVVHRDIKPANILRRASDGRLMLVDFGSVKATTQADGETIVGTAGYMPPEQAWGTATPQSDFYSLGVLGVVLLSRCEPHELLDSTHQLDWAPHVDCAPATRALLSELLRADPKERPESAESIRQGIARAREQLDNPRAASPTPSSRGPKRAVSQQPQRRAPGEIVEGHNHSEANPKRLVVVVAGVAITFLMGVGAFVAMFTVRSTEQPKVETLVVSTPDQPSIPVPDEPAPDSASGVAVLPDLEFGMSPDAVTDAVVPKRSWAEAKRGYELPGRRISIETDVADEPATCLFEFAVSNGLSAIRCDRHPLESSAEHRAAEERLRRYMVERLGPPSDQDTSGTTHDNRSVENRTWSWGDGGAGVEFSSRFQREGDNVLESRLRIRQATDAHRALVEDARAESRDGSEAH